MLTDHRPHHRPRRRRCAADEGTTLAELIVAISLTAVIGAMTLALFVQMNDATSRVVDGNISTASAGNALGSWSQHLAVADSPSDPGSSAGRLVRVTPTEIRFFADIGNRPGTCAAAKRIDGVCPPTPIEFALLDDGTLIEKRWAPTRSWPTGTPVTTRYLADGVSAAGWVFTPVVDGNPPMPRLPALCAGSPGICRAAPSAPSAPDAARAAALLDAVVRIDIRFRIAARGESAQRMFTTSVALQGRTP